LAKGKIDKGIILAAGDGGRLGGLTDTWPKVMLPVNGVPLIGYPIKALVSAGVSEIAVVVGYMADKVAASNLGVRLEYIFNPDYLDGNAISLYKARDWAQGEPILLLMGDHLVDAELVKRLARTPSLVETLAVDYTPAPHQLAEATRVAVDDNGFIKDIGKELASWDAIDTGAFLVTENFFAALAELCRHGSHIEISDGIRFFTSQGYQFTTCDVSGCFWADVDTREDLERVRQGWKWFTIG